MRKLAFKRIFVLIIIFMAAVGYIKQKYRTNISQVKILTTILPKERSNLSGRLTYYGVGKHSKLLRVQDVDRNDCELYKHEMNLTSVTAFNIFNAHNEENDICFTTQLDHSRLALLQKHIESWPGAMSVSVYADRNRFFYVIDFLKNILSEYNRRNVKINIVIQQGVYYPVNKLRNIAISQATCKYVLYVDVDFTLSENFYKRCIQHIGKGTLDIKHHALVIIAFDLMKKDYKLPRTKEELEKSWYKNETRQFHDYYPVAHAASDYKRWFQQHASYQIPQPPHGYEPYLLMKRSEAGTYDERFLEYFMNKVQYMDMLNLKNFTYTVLSDVFITHIPHRNRQTYAEVVSIERCVQQVYKKFLQELKEQSDGQ